MLPDQRRGLEVALVAYAAWGLLTIYWKALAEFDPFELIGWRITAATVVMVAITAGRRRLATIGAAVRDRATAALVVAAALLLTVNWTSYVWAVTHDRIVETALGYFLAPLGTIAIGTVIFGERLSVLQRWSIGCTAVAIVVLTWSYGTVPWVALLIGGSWSTYGLVKRRVPLGPIDSLTSELTVLVGPAVAVIAWGWSRSDGIPATAAGWEWPLIVLSGVVTAVPLTLFAYAAQRVPFTLLGPANYLVPIINFCLGWLAYGESVPPSRFVGFGLVWLSLTMVTVDTARLHRFANVLPTKVTNV